MSTTLSPSSFPSASRSCIPFLFYGLIVCFVLFAVWPSKPGLGPRASAARQGKCWGQRGRDEKLVLFVFLQEVREQRALPNFIAIIFFFFFLV